MQHGKQEGAVSKRVLQARLAAQLSLACSKPRGSDARASTSGWYQMGLSDALTISVWALALARESLT